MTSLFTQSVYRRLCAIASVLLVSIALAGCGGASLARQAGGHDEVTMTVNFYRSGCLGEGSFLCLQVSESDGNYANFFDAIEGFSFNWGYRTTLVVSREEIANPPADASSLRYTQVTEISSEWLGPIAEFAIWVPSLDLLLEKVTVNRYRLPDNQELLCSAADCATLDSLIAQQFWASMVLALPATPGDPLTLVRIDCSDAAAGFLQNCL
ncbi:MAG: DUF4377 domain-containing protein [Pseudomonadota bacterium]